MTPATRLVERLRILGLQIPQGARVRSMRPSPSQKSAGAWSWCLEVLQGDSWVPLLPSVGSHSSVLECATAHSLDVSLEFTDLTIDPLQGLPEIPRAISLGRPDPTFIRWDDYWRVLGVDSQMPIGVPTFVQRRDDTEATVTIGKYLAERWVTRRGTRQRVRYVIAEIHRDEECLGASFQMP